MAAFEFSVCCSLLHSFLWCEKGREKARGARIGKWKSFVLGCLSCARSFSSSSLSARSTPCEGICFIQSSAPEDNTMDWRRRKKVGDSREDEIVSTFFFRLSIWMFHEEPSAVFYVNVNVNEPEHFSRLLQEEGIRAHRTSRSLNNVRESRFSIPLCTSTVERNPLVKLYKTELCLLLLVFHSLCSRFSIPFQFIWLWPEK
jgi:hypothetical protein